MSPRMGPMEIPANPTTKELCPDGAIVDIDKKDVG